MSASAAVNSQKVIRVSNAGDYDMTLVNGELVLTLRESVPATTTVTTPAPQNEPKTMTVPETYVASSFDMTRGKDERACVPEGTKQYVCYKNDNPNAICKYVSFIPNILPDTIEAINCTGIGLVELPDPLPANLNTLNCAYNNLTALPAKLPTGLKFLNCEYNKVTVLPDLPNTLIQLYVNNGNHLFKNYPKLYGTIPVNSIGEAVDYVNQRNREMRDNPEPIVVTEADLFKTYSFDFSTIKQCKIVTNRGRIIFSRNGNGNGNDIIYRDIAIELLCKMSLPDIIKSDEFNVKLRNQRGDDGYIWSEEVGLSIKLYSNAITLRKIINIVNFNKWHMTIVIKIHNNKVIQFTYPESA